MAEVCRWFIKLYERFNVQAFMALSSNVFYIELKSHTSKAT
ncbi:hypothetical protein [Tepidibacter aestuarii]|nr:hypothetical protein [Tepidibacter aestuarii]